MSELMRMVTFLRINAVLIYIYYGVQMQGA